DEIANKRRGDDDRAGAQHADRDGDQKFTAVEPAGLLHQPPGSHVGRFDLAFRAPAGAGPRFRGRCTRRHPRIGDLTHTPIIKIPPRWKRVLTFAPPEVVPLSPAERLGIAVARLGKGGSSQSGTTSSNPPSSSGESVSAVDSRSVGEKPRAFAPVCSGSGTREGNGLAVYPLIWPFLSDGH